MHGVAGAFGQRRFIGRVHTGLSERNGFLQDLGPECLRRLRQEDRFARDRLDHGERGPIAADAFHGVADRLRHDCGPVLDRRLDRLRDQITGHERPRRIVHQHHVGALAHGPERVGNRILPAGAASHGAVPQPVTQLQRRSGSKLRRQRDDDVVDLGMRRERGDAAVEDRQPADVEQLLRHTGAEPVTGAAGRDDGSHVHGLGWVECRSGQTLIIALPRRNCLGPAASCSVDPVDDNPRARARRTGSRPSAVTSAVGIGAWMIS